MTKNCCTNRFVLFRLFILVSSSTSSGWKLERWIIYDHRTLWALRLSASFSVKKYRLSRNNGSQWPVRMNVATDSRFAQLMPLSIIIIDWLPMVLAAVGTVAEPKWAQICASALVERCHCFCLIFSSVLFIRFKFILNPLVLHIERGQINERQT